jgi:anti-sigma regulatory factor (Ser/Thr protein kinase)
MASSTRIFPAARVALGEIRAFLREEALRAGLPERATEDLVLAVSEACANAVLHSGSERIEVMWTVTDSAVEVDVRDHGRFKRRVRMPQVEGPGGYGIPLMMALTDQVVIREGTPDHPGTHVRLVKRRTASAPAPGQE